MIYFITCLVIAVVAFCFGLFFDYISKYPTFLEEDKPKHELSPAHDSVIQSFINNRWYLQAQIRECDSLKDMATLYWKIEELETEFKDAIPDQVLITHIDELFAAHARCALALQSKLKIASLHKASS
jgi:hypothetical protein